MIAIVVQPGVEFGGDFVIPYDRHRAAGLSRFIEDCPNMVYEAHSTDYQSLEALKQMVADHFAILKVGPALTFAFREAVFSLSAIEREMYGESHLPEIVEAAMLRNPAHWLPYYQGDERQQAIARRFSLSDRIRYYWAVPEVDFALRELIDRMEQHPPPLSSVSQYAPEQYHAIRDGRIRNQPVDIIQDKIRQVSMQYAIACGLSTVMQ